jgi:hypothetical protein
VMMKAGFPPADKLCQVAIDLDNSGDAEAD